MKKFKEFLWFLIPFLAIGVLSVLVVVLRIGLGYLVNTGTVEFMSIANCIRLLLEDESIYKMFFNMYFAGTICSVVFIGLFTLICKGVSKRRQISKRFYRIGSIVIGTVTTIVLQVIRSLITTFWSLADIIQIYTQIFNLTPSIVIWHIMGIFQFFFAIQSAIFAAFLFWLIETIVGAIKNKKQQVIK